MMLEDITEFKIVGGWGLQNLGYDVIVPGRKRPVARFNWHRKLFDALADTDRWSEEYRVHIGPELDSPAGTITRNGAYDLAGESLGFVKTKRVRLGSIGNTQELHQEGFGVLIGNPVGAGANLLKRPGMNYVPFASLKSSFTKSEMSYRSDFSAGFDVTRFGGRSNCHFKVHDPRISKLLMFCCFLTL